MVELRLPNIKGKSEREQLAEIKSYLHQFVEQLQFALNSMPTQNSYVQPQVRGGISLFNTKGDEIPLGSTMPLPRAQVSAGYDPNALENGVHVIANNYALKQGDTVIMYNGVLIQMNGDVGGNVKLQLAFPVDEGRNPMYRLCWYSNWSDWRSMKL